MAPAPEHQGRLATEAARAVLAVTGTAGIDEVLAITDLDNTPSQRAAALWTSPTRASPSRPLSG